MDDEIRIQDLADDEIRELLLEEGSELDEQQAAALKEIYLENHVPGKPILIRGVTCSGKTEIYLRWVAEQIAQALARYSGVVDPVS